MKVYEYLLAEGFPGAFKKLQVGGILKHLFNFTCLRLSQGSQQ
jgi:hypothetical protein